MGQKLFWSFFRFFIISNEMEFSGFDVSTKKHYVLNIQKDSKQKSLIVEKKMNFEKNEYFVITP